MIMHTPHNRQGLLDELRREQTLHAVSTWKDCYPFFADDQRFRDLVGQPGSTPLALFKVGRIPFEARLVD